jgi:hypothetical protein
MSGEGEFERRIREQLIESSDALDGRARSRLTQARYRALEQVSGSRGLQRFGWRGLAPAGAVAMALLVTVFYVRQRADVVPGSVVVAQSVAAMDDLDLLADADMYALSADVDQELDADFYEWAADEAGNGPVT